MQKKTLIVFRAKGGFLNYYKSNMEQLDNVEIKSPSQLISMMKQSSLKSFANYLNSYARIVFWECEPSTVFFYFLVKKKNKCIFWIWNSLEKADKKNWRWYFLCMIRKNVWTFDKSDSKKYGWQLNSQVYFKTNNILYNDTNCVKRAFFCGRDKGRRSILSSLGTELRRNGVLCDFFLVDSCDCKDDNITILTNEMQYKEFLTHIKKSEIIVDLVKNDQTGLTVRALEALYFGKKIITNNHEIVHERLYNENNVYVIKEKYVGLNTFLGKEYKIPSAETLEYYDFPSWLERFPKEKGDE